MATINVEIRVKRTGPVFKRDVFIDDTNTGSLLANGWIYDNSLKLEKYFLHNYTINDDILNIFFSCEGREGGKIKCEVLIGGNLKTDITTQKTYVEAENISNFPTHGKYTI